MNDHSTLFVSVPISSFSEPKAALTFEQITLRLLHGLRSRLNKWQIYCAAEAVNKRGGYESPAKATQDDLAALSRATHFLLLYPAKVPTSALIELGFAIARGLPIVTVTNSRSTLPFMAQGLDSFHRSFSIIESDMFNNGNQRILVDEIAVRLLQ
jgi:hypothetical protein